MLCVLTVAARVLAAGEPAAPESGTARDVIFRADAAYNGKQYTDAVAGYEKFLTDFGASSEAAPLLPHVRYNLVAALMQVQKYSDAVEAISEAQKLKEMTPKQGEDLLFWLGVAHLQAGNPQEANKALDQFSTAFPNSSRRADVAMLVGTALLASAQQAEAAKLFSTIRHTPQHPHRGRAAVLELHCLIETGQDAPALALLAEEGPAMDKNINQIANFQILALRLGEKLLEEGRPRDAIRALQNIWPRERLITRQRGKLGEIKARLVAIERSPHPDVFARNQQQQLQREVEKELADLEKIPSFDASVRFRMATAFHRQDRFRECAILLDDMLHQMKPDPVVETASLSALQSWMAAERYDKAVDASRLFEKNFSASKSLPLVLYLRGTAQQKAGSYDEAIKTLAQLQEKFPSSDQAQRAVFMTGFTQLLAERNDEAADTFRKFLEKNERHELAEAGHYWLGSALAFAKKYPEAREVLGAHTEKFPTGSLRSAAAFRNAYCAQSIKDYAQAEKELKQLLQDFPQSQESAEARLMLGDALLAEGKSDEGKEVYASVPSGTGHSHEEAQFKMAKVLKLEEDFEGIRELMNKYLQAYPRSPRAAEALYLIGQSWRQQDQPEKAAAEYWKAINQFGDDPEAGSVEEMFVALGKSHKSETEQRDYLAELRSLRDRAASEGKKVLVVRTIWALSQAVKKSDPALAGSLLREAAALAKPENTDPMILADFAAAQMSAATSVPETNESATRKAKAAQLYRDLLKWHPRAAQKDKALAALAQFALDAGDTQAALDYYGRLERDAPWSPLMGDALMTRARLELEAGRNDQAAGAYTRLLAAEGVSGKLKAQALLAIGDIEMARSQPKLAIPYYQRIYILYGKWRETVADAYLRSGEAFEQLQDKEAARKTYEELLSNEDLTALPQAATAREKLKKFAPSGAQSPS